MHFNQENEIVRLCAKGMEMEGKGQPAEAAQLFSEAWEKAKDDVEKFTAAHYVARQQPDVAGKLTWDMLALQHALQIKDDTVKAVLPSLYLNVGKCYEDLCEFEKAALYYQAGLSCQSFLPDDGYGQMIGRGLQAGMQRVAEKNNGQLC